MIGKSKTYLFLFVLFWIFFLHGVGLWAFTRGFFLTRFEVEEKSECNVPPHSGIDDISLFNSPTRERDFPDCWMHRRFKKAIFILFDALRTDFLWYNSSIPMEKATHFQNKMPKANKIAAEQRLNAEMFRYIADPPTATTQRLKALTTGSLPTFFEISKSFTIMTINEDSFVHQLGVSKERKGGATVFMGDDTWSGLYPDMFSTDYPYPCFNVKDLDTVDYGCTEHLVPTILNDSTSPWRLIVAHYLGIDHCGHTFGTDFPCMERKLSEFDDVIENVRSAIDSDTLVFAFGDHGLTFDGNHGGATFEETNAGMLLFSKRAFLNRDFLDEARRIQFESGGTPKTEENSGVEIEDYLPPRFPENLHPMMQIDMVPSLTLSLGAPVPFSSLGQAMPEVFSYVDPDHVEGTRNSRSSVLLSFSQLNTAMRLICHQVNKYINTYNRLHSFPSDVLSRASELLDEAEIAYSKITIESNSLPRGDEEKGEEDFGESAWKYIESTMSIREIERDIVKHREAYGKFVEFHTLVASFCRHRWTAFDFVHMGWGTAVVCVSMFLSWLLVTEVTPNALSSISGFELWSWSIGMAVGLILSFLSIAVRKIGIFGLESAISLGVGMLLGGLIGQFANLAALVSLKKLLLKSASLILSWDIVSQFTVVLMMFHGYSLFTNSFIIEDHNVVHFLLSSIVMLYWFNEVSHKKSSSLVKRVTSFSELYHSPSFLATSTLLLVRISVSHTRSYQTDFGLSGRILFPPLFEKYLPLLGFPLLVLFVISKDGLSSSSSGDVHLLLLKFGSLITSIVNVILIGVYWGYEDSGLLSSSEVMRFFVPRLLYSISFLLFVLTLGILYFQWKARRRAFNALNIGPEAHIGKTVKNDLSSPSGRMAVMMPTVAISASIFAPMLLVLGGIFCLSFLCFWLQILLFFGISKSVTDRFHISSRGSIARSSSTPHHLPIFSVFCFLLIGYQYFFAFGHHFQFNTLHFTNAFVGFEEFNLWINGTLLLLDTFGSFLIPILYLPLLSVIQLSLPSHKPYKSTRWRSPSLLPNYSRLPILLTICYFGFHALFSVSSVAVQRRHLMIWMVFSPKFIFDVLILVVIDIGCVVSYLLSIFVTG